MKKFIVVILACFILVTPTFGATQKELTIWWGPNDDTFKNVVATYQEQHPNVKLTYEEKTFEDLKTTLRLTLSNNEGPDICVSNQGVQDMGSLVKDGLIVPLDKYYQKYGWDKLYGPAMIMPNRFDKNTMKMGVGPIFGVSPTAEFGLFFYNKALFAKAGIKGAPKNFAEFESDLAILKGKGITPLVVGGQDGGRWVWWFEVLLGNYAPQNFFEQLAFDPDNKVIHGNASLATLTKMQSWAKKDYFNKGFLGVTPDDALKMFVAGQAAIYLDGHWATHDIIKYSKATNTPVGLFLSPTKYGVTFGAPSSAVTISKKCSDPDLAADFLNFFITDTKIHIKYNSLPIAKNGDFSKAEPMYKQMCNLANEVYSKNLTGYYIDWSTATMFDTLSSNIQDLMSQKTTPAECMKKFNDDFARAHTKK